MFYEEKTSKALRFGDVVVGYVSSVPKIKEPTLNYRHPEYNLELCMPDYCVVLSPCCSIGASTITLAKLECVINKFFATPFFAADPTNINRPVPPERSIPPEKWDQMADEEKQRKLAEGDGYVFLDYFIYGEHDLLPRYDVRLKGNNIQTGCYMIDFRKTFRVICDKVVNAEKSPIESKYLQLSVRTRQELRDKISKYYTRMPSEDIAALQAA